jgi:hypothetical protein
MSYDERRLTFWLALWLFLNLLGLLVDPGDFIWFPIVMAWYHFGRMTMAEEVREAGHV